jgi:hypothetical protein
MGRQHVGWGTAGGGVEVVMEKGGGRAKSKPGARVL